MNRENCGKKQEDFFDPLEFEKEQKRLEEYVRRRRLVRPETTKITVVLLVLLYLVLSLCVAVAVIYAFQFTRCKWLVFLISYITVGLLLLKTICIKAIECYQHYAKEETRRRCLCVPSCSEYSIAVLKKYNVFKALHKIRIRLFKTCRGGFGYIHDEP